jgi:hypothetical protein
MCLPAFSRETKYPVSQIPASLLKNAQAVVRADDHIVETKSNGEVTENVVYAITILNKNGQPLSVFREGFDKNTRVSNISVNFYDEFGKEFKKKGGYEIKDVSAVDDEIFTDQRTKIIDPEIYSYPFTVEYSYVISYHDVINYPGWYPVKYQNVSVQSSSFSLRRSTVTDCRFYEINIPPQISNQAKSGELINSWVLQNKEAIVLEPFTASFIDIMPIVLVSPNELSVEGYQGNFTTWKDIGFWYYQLINGRNKLSSKTKSKMMDIISQSKNDKEKVRLIYEYVQSKTRYVSIKEGIGGFQPIDAETTDRLSYGDCKALSNYTKSLLEAVGIKAYYTRVKAGEENTPTIKAFPSNQFNHIIVCVPLDTDTVWLECTDQRQPFNYLGTFTANRDVLLITEEGGKMVHTPDMPLSANSESRSAKVILDNNGFGEVKVTACYHGEPYDRYQRIWRSNYKDRKELISARIQIPSFSLTDFNLSEDRSENPSIKEELTIEMSQYLTKVGEKLLLPVNLLNRIDATPFTESKRVFPISFTWAVNESDTVSFIVPLGYTIEKAPAPIVIKSEFGQYSSQVIKLPAGLQYIRSFQLYAGTYPVEKYEGIMEFFDKIVTADAQKVALSYKP